MGLAAFCALVWFLESTSTLEGGKIMGQIRFMKHYITDGEHKARVFYSAYRMTTTKQLCVALYAKDYTNDLH